VKGSATESAAVAGYTTMKVKKEFHDWLKVESAKRKIFLYELLEDLASHTLDFRRLSFHGSHER